MLRLEARRRPSRLMIWLSPLLAVALTCVIGGAVFAALGKDRGDAMKRLADEANG